MNPLNKSDLVLVGAVSTMLCLMVCVGAFWLTAQSSQPVVAPVGSTGPPVAAQQYVDEQLVEQFDGPIDSDVLSSEPSNETTLLVQTAAPETLVKNAPPLITELMAENGNTQLGGDGTFEDWIEIHNPSPDTIDLAGYFVTDDDDDLKKWKITSLKIKPGGFAIISAAGDNPKNVSPRQNIGLFQQAFRQFQFPGSRSSSNRARRTSRPQANFKLSLKGEYLALVEPDGETVVHDYKPKFPKQIANVSYGIPLAVAGSDEQRFTQLLRPTPGAVNSQELKGFAPNVTISQPHGYYDSPIEVTLECGNPEFEIRYTLDGSVPTSTHGTVYSQPLHIENTTAIRAAAFREQYKTLHPQTVTYLFLDDVVEQTRVPPDGFPQRSRVNSQRLRFGMDPGVVQRYSKPAVVNSLRSLPALCIWTDNDNLFGRRNGIYVNAESSGRSWERPASLELLNPDGTDGFQINAGLRIRGGYSRRGVNSKHAFRMVFRKEFGQGKLEYPLFGAEGADEFDHIDFRTSLNYSWAEGSSQNNFLRDVFSRDAQRDMGQPYTRSRYYHMFLNGQYWGIYQTQERAVAAYASTYLGGKEEDYDVVKNAGNFQDGNEKAYSRFYEEVQKGITDERYFRLQGLNTDGTPNPRYEKLLDVDNLIDYMAITYYTGDRDGPSGRFTRMPNNYVAIFNRKKPDGWKYFEHDSEHSLDTGDEDMTRPFKQIYDAQSFNPHWLHDQLVANKHYLKRFRQRMDLHFGLDGALSHPKSLARLEQRENEVSGAIIAHAARWGGNNLNYERWQQSVERTKRWMEGRTEVVYDQLREVGWLPGPQTPVLSMISGTVTAGTPLFATTRNSSDVIYYTLDGSDPRGADDKPSESAKQIAPASLNVTELVKEDSPVRAFIPSDGSLRMEWAQPEFAVNSDWMRGKAPVGYETNSGYQGIISLDVRRPMFRQNTSLYVRYEFSIAEELDDADTVILQMKFDDGFIAYLDGKKMASRNAPFRPSWNSSASGDNSDGRAANFEDFHLPSGTLEKGDHVLAIHALDGRSSSDFLMAARLVAQRFSGESLKIQKPTQVIMRTYDPVEKLWSGFRTATFRTKSP